MINKSVVRGCSDPNYSNSYEGAISMCIYCGTTNYRKIYENHYGPIPKDETGRSYEIHHIDGNHSNNDPENLKAVTIQEHYDIHYSQQDWVACLIMSDRMKISPEEKSSLAKQHAQERVNKGEHHFSKRLDGSSLASDRVIAGTHPLMTLEYKNNARMLQELKAEMGIHVFQDKELTRKNMHTLISEGKHPTCHIWTCEVCGKTGKSKTNYTRWHGTNCGKIIKYSDKGKEKCRATVAKKYEAGYINPASKVWRITDTLTGEVTEFIGLKTWAEQNNYNASTVDWSVRKHGRYKHFIIIKC